MTHDHADKCNPCFRVLREYYLASAKSTGRVFTILFTIDCFLAFCMMAGMFEMIVEALGSRLYLMGFLPRPAEIKLRDLIAVTDIDRIEDQAVDQRLSGVSQNVSEHRCRKRSS